MKTLEEIREMLRAHKEDLRERFAIVDLSIFGSVVRGEAHEKSDIDILLTFSEPVGLIRLIDAENYISDLLNAKADCIPSDEIRPELQQRIFSEAAPV
jgi:uncharacterized protein